MHAILTLFYLTCLILLLVRLSHLDILSGDSSSSTAPSGSLSLPASQAIESLVNVVYDRLPSNTVVRLVHQLSEFSSPWMKALRETIMTSKTTHISRTLGRFESVLEGTVMVRSPTVPASSTESADQCASSEWRLRCGASKQRRGEDRFTGVEEISAKNNDKRTFYFKVDTTSERTRPC